MIHFKSLDIYKKHLKVTCNKCNKLLVYKGKFKRFHYVVPDEEKKILNVFCEDCFKPPENKEEK